MVVSCNNPCPMSPSAKSLILDLLSTLRRGTMPVQALVTAGTLFGIADNALRVALARLLAAGLVERDERGQYRLGGHARPLDTRVHGWRKLGERLVPWDDRWLAVHTGGMDPRASARTLRRRERALGVLGFECLERDLHLRPANLAPGVSGIRRELEALGLESGALVFELGSLDPVAEARARGLWDEASLLAAYRASRADLEESERQLRHLEPDEARVESFLLGGRVLRQLALDPLLPEPILPSGEREALIDAMQRYDRLGRACWAGFLERFGVPTQGTPADTRAGEDAVLLH